MAAGALAGVLGALAAAVNGGKKRACMKDNMPTDTQDETGCGRTVDGDWIVKHEVHGKF